MVSDLKIGDKVEIVNYGLLGFINKSKYSEYKQFLKEMSEQQNERELKFVLGEDYVPTKNTRVQEYDLSPKPDNIISEDKDKWWVDFNPKIVGKNGVISKIQITQGIVHYSLENMAWFTKNQLKKIE